MHVLFIGGTGLISTAIARQLLESGHQVTLFNRGQSENRLPEGAQVIHGDRKKFAEFESQFEGKTYDVVVDMVAFSPEETASAIRAFSGRTNQFIHCSTVCVYSGPVEQLPTTETASAIRAFSGRTNQFIHCSTVCVYSGPVEQLPTTETEPFHSLGSYGQKKIECEKLLFDAHQNRNFPMTIMRPSHSYGEGGSLTRSFGPGGAFVTRMRQHLPLLVQGDGNSLWAACHVDDVARGFIGTMGNPKCIGQAYNICGEEWMTWNTYYQQIAQVTGGEYNPVHIPTDSLREIAPDWAGGTWEIFSWPSIFEMSKLRRDTGYSGQTISWKEGVKRTVSWMESQGKLSADEKMSADFAREDKIIAAWREGVGRIDLVASEK